MSGFYKDSSKKEGIRNYCKACALEMNRKNKKAFGKAVEEDYSQKEKDKVVHMVSYLIRDVVRTIAFSFGCEVVDGSIELKIRKK